MIRGLLAVSLLICGLAGSAMAQNTPLFQEGVVQPSDIAKYTRNGMVRNPGGVAGDNNGMGVNPFAVTDFGAPGICSNSAKTTGGYSQVCLGHDSSGTGIISFDSRASEPAHDFQICHDGLCVPFPFVATGGVAGPLSTTVGDMAVWANATGTLVSMGPPLRVNIPNGAQNITVSPYGNTLTTASTLSIVGTTQQPSQREYLTNLNMLSTTGAGSGNTGQGDKATSYMSIVASANSGNTWAINPLVQVDAASPIQGHHQVSELDMNNNARDVDPTLGPAGMQFPPPSNTATGDPGSGKLYIYGEQVECSGSHNCTSGIDIDGANKFHRGIGMGPTAAVDQASFYDYGNAPIVLDVWGNHQTIIDVANTHMPAGGTVIHLSATNAFIQDVVRRDNFFVLTAVGDFIKYSGTNPGDQIIGVGGTNDGTLALGSKAIAGTNPAVNFHHSGSTTPDVQLIADGNTLLTIRAGGAQAAQIGTNGLSVGAANAAIGSGTVNATAYLASGNAGVNCSGAPTGSFATIGGIVTHC